VKNINDKYSFYIILSVVLIFFIGFAIYFFRIRIARKKNNKKYKREDIEILLEEDIEKKFNKMVNDFNKSAISYYIYLEYIKSNITSEKAELLFKKYGKVIIIPQIYVYDYFKDIKQNYYKVEEYLNQYLEMNNYSDYSELLPAERLKKMLLERAEIKVNKIIKGK